MPDALLETARWATEDDLLEARRREVAASHSVSGASGETRRLLRRYLNDALAFGAGEASLAGPAERGRLGAALLRSLDLPQSDPVLGSDITAQLDAFAAQRSIASNDPTQLRPQRSAGRVDVSTGQAIWEATDLLVRGGGIDFVFQRSFASHAAYFGPLGAAWNHRYNLWLRELGQDLVRSARAVREDAFVRHPKFGQAGFDYWVPPEGQAGIIVEGVGSASFVWRAPNGERVVYADDPARPGLHRGTRVEDRFGNALELLYDGDGRLEEVLVNSPGRRVRFTYDDDNRIVELRDHTGRACRYEYDDFGDLVAVTSPATSRYGSGLTTTYEYASADFAPVRHNLARVVDPAGRVVVEFEYGIEPGQVGFNRVVGERRGSGEARFEYELIVNEFDNEYDASERPFLQVNQVARNGQLVHQVLNVFGNLLLREEVVFERGLERLYQWRYRYNRDGHVVAALTPTGSLTQSLYGRDHYLHRHGITDEEVATHPDLTAAERMAFGNLLATVQRGRRRSLASLDLSRGVWGDVFPDIYVAESEDVVTKYTYESAFQQLSTLSDPRFTASPDPSHPETPRYAATLTRRSYGGPPSDPALFLTGVRYPDFARPDGSTVTNIREEFECDPRGRLLRRRDRAGTISEFRYFGPADGVKDGHLRAHVSDAAGLALETVRDVDARGNTTAVRHPRAVGALPGRFVTKLEVNELDQLVRVESSPPFSFVSTFSFDRAGQLERVEQELIDEQGVPRLGGRQVERYGYDAEGNLTRQSLGGLDPRTELTARHRYDDAGLRTVTVTPRGSVTRRVYDARMRKVRETRGAGTGDAATTRTEYDADDRLTAVRSGRGFVTRYEYDALGRVTAIVDARGSLTRRDYDKAGNVIIERLFERDSAGGFALLTRSEFTYDELHHLIRIGRNLFPDPLPVGDTEATHRAAPGPGTVLVTELFYDARGQLERVVDPQGREQRIEYDALGRDRVWVDAIGNRTELRYDAHDNLVRRDEHELVRDPATGAVVGVEVFSTAYGYDELDRLTTQTDGLGNRTTFAHDSLDRPVSVTDPLGNINRTIYEIHGRVEEERRERTATGLGGGPGLPPVSSRYAYDADGNPVALIDPNGNQTTQEFDALGRQRAITYADGSVARFSYDRDDNLVTVRDANGAVRASTFDELGRRTRVDVDLSGVPPGLAVEGETFEEYVYDGRGRILVERNDFAQIESRPDSLGRVVEEVWSFPASGLAPVTLARNFDPAGGMALLIYPGGRRIRYRRDALDRVDHIENETKGAGYPGSTAFADRYDVATIHYRGRRQDRLAFGNGAGSEVAWDGHERPIQIEHVTSGGTPVLTHQYLYDGRGNARIRNDLEPAGARTGERFQYDSLSRLTSIDRTGGIPSFAPAAFAPPSLPPPDPIPNQQAAIDALIGSLAQGPSPTFVYDVAGNRQVEQRPGQPPVAYTSNALNQYTGVGATALAYDRSGNLRSSGALAFVYDSRNLLVRVRDAVQGVDLVRFLHDARGRRIAEERAGTTTHLVSDGPNVLEEYRAGTVAVQYVHVGGIDSACQLVHSGNEYWLHRDAIGSTRLLTSQTGAVAGRYRYDAFGVIEHETGPYNPVRFAGRRLDADVGLYDLRARSYSPALGRFVQRDPKDLAASTNLYQYAADNPLLFTDPFGMDLEQHFWAGLRADTNERVDAFLAEARAGLSSPLREIKREATSFYTEIGSGFPSVRKAYAEETGPVGFWEVPVRVLGVVNRGNPMYNLMTKGWMADHQADLAVEARAFGYYEKAARLTESSGRYVSGYLWGIPDLAMTAAPAPPVGKALQGKVGKLVDDVLPESTASKMDRAVKADASKPLVEMQGTGPVRPESAAWAKRDEIQSHLLREKKLSEGLEALPTQFPNKQGLDEAFVNFARTEKEIAELKAIIGFKPQDLDRALKALKNTRYGRQGSAEYVRNQTKRLLTSEKASDALRETGVTLSNIAETRRTLSIMDENLNLTNFDLEFWEMYRW